MKNLMTGVIVTGWLSAVGACAGPNGIDLFCDAGHEDAGAGGREDRDAGSDACAQDGGCACNPGTTRCAPDSPGVDEVCVAQDGGAGVWAQHPCSPGSFCSPGIGCVMCPGECAPGTVECSEDTKTVTACTPDPSTGCRTLRPAVSCPAAGMASCAPPPAGTMVTDLTQYCVNECGGRGVPLPATQCDPAANVPCAVLVCDASTHMLVPDHAGCVGGGLGCQKDADCKSCNCSGGVCIGNTQKSCSPACQ